LGDPQKPPNRLPKGVKRGTFGAFIINHLFLEKISEKWQYKNENYKRLQ